MIADLKPYPKMKDSGISWLGNVPEHWKVIPVAAIAQQKSVINQQDRELLSVYLNLGVIRFSDIKEKRTNVTSDDLSKYQAVDPGDFVLNNQQAWRGSVGVSKHKGIVSPAYLVLSLTSNINPEYANLLFRDRSMVGQYVVCSKGVGSIQRNLYWPHLKRVSTVLPPLAEQAAIVHFLDHAEQRIRRYIHAKQKLVKLLEEQKQTIIHRTVTRGLDPNVRLKHSGVEWLGNVPEHWEVQRLKRLCSRSALYGANIAASSYTATGVRFLRTTDIAENGQLKGGGVFLPEELVRDYLLADGDVLISRSGTIGRSFLYDAQSHGPCAYAGYLVRFVPALDILPKYLFLFTKTQAFDGFLRVMAISSTIENVNGEKYANCPFLLPPKREQAAIVEYLEYATADIDNVIDRAQREISLFREYRTRLIADVVTGNFDVREAAMNLPEIDQLESKGLNEIDDITDLEDDVVNDFEETLEGAAI